MILPFTANALSATTAKTIKGTEPTFKALSGENRLGFTVGGKFYSESSTDTATTGNIVAGTSKSFNASLTFNDFAVKTLTASDFTVAGDYDDSDGDGARTTGTGAFTIGATTYRWLKADGNEVPPSQYSNMIGCGSGYAMPLKLEITLDNVQVHSEYGDPRDSVLTPLKKTYQINSTTGICNAKPNQMIVDPTQTWYGVNASGVGTGWNNAANTTRNSVNGGGYSSDFDPVNGFKASASTKFPTTGFPNAQFQLVMTGAQTDWTYKIESSHTSDIVSVDTTGNVLLSQKPVGEVIVSATLTGVTPVVKHEYKFTLATNGWFVPKSGGYTWGQAKMACTGGVSGLPMRAELTNSPRNTEPLTWTPVPNYYTRAIGGGVFGEWGWTDSTRYPGSLWIASVYWISDLLSDGYRVTVIDAPNGGVLTGGAGTGYVVCRG